MSIYIDVEFGNQYSFYSGIKNIDVYKYPLKELSDECVSVKAEIRGAAGEVKDNLYLCDKGLYKRSVTFHPKRNSEIFDFVSRYVITTTSPIASIGGRKVEHKSSNVYHQYPSKKNPVKVPLSCGRTVIFSEVSASIEENFDNVFYLRDESFENGEYKWIVHHRKIVKKNSSRLIVRSCNPRFEGVLPFDNMIPGFVKRLLFRIRERKFPNFPLMAVGVVKLDSKPLILTSEVYILNEKREI
nr:hypothetical protein [Vibrio mimicus]